MNRVMDRALRGVASVDKVEGAASPLLYLFRRAVRALTESKEQKKVRAVVDEAASTFVDVLSRAEDRKDLEFKLQTLVVLPQLARIDRAVKKLPQEQVEEAVDEMASNDAIADGLNEQLGRAITRHLLKGFRYTKACADAQRRGDIDALGKFFPEELQKKRGSEGAFPLTDSPAIPVELAESLLRALKGDVALISLLALIQDRRKLEPWMALALAELYELGQFERLRFWTLVPNSGVRTDLVPANKRWDLETLSNRHRARAEKFREIAREVRKHRRPYGKLPAD